MMFWEKEACSKGKEIVIPKCLGDLIWAFSLGVEVFMGVSALYRGLISQHVPPEVPTHVNWSVDPNGMMQMAPCRYRKTVKCAFHNLACRRPHRVQTCCLNISLLVECIMITMALRSSDMVKAMRFLR